MGYNYQLNFLFELVTEHDITGLKSHRTILSRGITNVKYESRVASGGVIENTT